MSFQPTFGSHIITPPGNRKPVALIHRTTPPSEADGTFSSSDKLEQKKTTVESDVARSETVKSHAIRSDGVGSDINTEGLYFTNDLYMLYICIDLISGEGEGGSKENNKSSVSPQPKAP